MDIHLLYSDDAEMPEEEDAEYLIIEDCQSNDDDEMMEHLGEDTVLADKSIYPERFGFQKMLEIYLNPDQVDENKEFLRAFLNAKYVWVWSEGGWYASNEETPGPLESTFEYGVRKMSFADLLENPLVVRSVGVF